MKTQLLLLFIALGGIACQPNDASTFGIDPQLGTYTDEAPMTKKLICGSINCENPSSEEVYTYNAAGQVARMEQFSRAISGQMERFGYTDYLYAPNGQLSSKITYGKYGNTATWVPYNESTYVYTNGVLSQEQTYFNQHSPEQRVLTATIDYTFQDGKKTEQKWFDAQHILNHRVVYEYRNNTLVRETWSGANDVVFRRFEHRFADNRRQISEYLPNSTEQISLVEKTYDAQGRLASEETKVNNPLLCSMMAGVIRYVY
ncbi:hypothetical protein [Spirosoma jeollabukense]